MSERASADVCVVPRALRQRLGEGAGVRRRLYSLQLPRAEVCEVAVVVVVVVEEEEEKTRETRLNRAVRGMPAGGFCVGMQV